MMVNANDSNATGPVGPDLLGRLADRHAAALELYARQLCDSPQDVVQETLVQLAGLARGPDDALGWVYCVVRNRALSAARAARPGQGRGQRVSGKRAAISRSSRAITPPEERVDVPWWRGK